MKDKRIDLFKDSKYKHLRDDGAYVCFGSYKTYFYNKEHEEIFRIDGGTVYNKEACEAMYLVNHFAFKEGYEKGRESLKREFRNLMDLKEGDNE